MTEIRDAEPADLESLTTLDAELFGADDWPRATMLAELAAVGETRSFLVATSASELVGFAILLVAAEVADVQRIAVATAAQRQGLGTRLLATLLERAAGAGCERVLLEVGTGNAAAIALYQSLGFDEVARRPGYYRGGADALVMARELPRTV